MPTARDSAATAGAAPATHRPQRTGNEQLESPVLRDFLSRLRRNTREFDAEGRVLRLKRYISAVATSNVLNAVLDALAVNTRVEVLYIQNFEKGFTDEQLHRLTQVLKLRRIWAVNVGENFGTTLPAWRRFADALPETNVQYMYASEHHFLRTDLKTRMRDAIRVNRKAQCGEHDPAVVRCVGNMWFNPKVGGSAGRACSGGGGSGELQRASNAAERLRRRRLAAEPSSPSRVVQLRPGKRRLVLTERAAAAAPSTPAPLYLKPKLRKHKKPPPPPPPAKPPQKTRTAVLKRRRAEAQAAAAPEANKRPRRTAVRKPARY